MKKKNKVRQILIWLGFFIMFFNMSNYWQPINYALISAIFDTLVLFIAYRITVDFLFPRFYGKQRQYILISMGVIAALSALFYLIDMNLIPRIKNVEQPQPPMFFHFMRMLMVNSFTFFIATSVSLMEHNNRLRENEKLLTEEKLETELKLLKAQINPHFIFNALNNIYSLTYMQSKNAPDSVLKLSEMLRYVFYDCNKDKVPISSEVKYIENFISFQQMKSEFTQNISLQTEIGSTKIEIAPMIFISFIENAFKYSRIEEDENAFVSISLKLTEKILFFNIENNLSSENKPLSGSGTGIKNVKDRLNIIYPEKHTLMIKEDNDIYTLNLSIEL